MTIPVFFIRFSRGCFAALCMLITFMLVLIIAPFHWMVQLCTGRTMTAGDMPLVPRWLSWWVSIVDP